MLCGSLTNSKNKITKLYHIYMIVSRFKGGASLCIITLDYTCVSLFCDINNNTKIGIAYGRASLSSCMPSFSVYKHNSFSWVRFDPIQSVPVTTLPYPFRYYIESVPVRFGPGRYFLSLLRPDPIRFGPIGSGYFLSPFWS